jgi:hypothetical protein
MSNTHDEKLEELLRSRRFEPASPDLAERIVLKAQNIPQNQPIPLTQWMKQLFAEFHLPKPAYVLAGTLALGFVVGFYRPLDTIPDDADTVHVQSFLYADEEPL